MGRHQQGALFRLLPDGPLLSLQPPAAVYFLVHRPTPWGSLSQLEGRREEEQKEGVTGGEQDEKKERR